MECFGVFNAMEGCYECINGVLSIWKAIMECTPGSALRGIQGYMSICNFMVSCLSAKLSK